MSTIALAPQIEGESLQSSIQHRIETIIDDLIAQLPSPESLTSAQRQGIIARYSGVLEGNFIYWMTAAYISLKTDEARAILGENLFEEVRDSHPNMMRRFAVAANAYPSEADMLATNEEVTRLRLFLGKLESVPSVLTMALFEGWIQRFMAYLADLAGAQGSSEREYTDVHGVLDIAHTAGLFNALALEMAVNPISPDADLFEGVDLLRNLIVAMVQGPAKDSAA